MACGSSHPVIVPIVYVLATWAMIPLAFGELGVHRLPDRIEPPAYPILAALIGTCSHVTDEWGSPGPGAEHRGCLWMFFLILVLVMVLPRGGIGLGDVNLSGLLWDPAGVADVGGANHRQDAP